MRDSKVRVFHYINLACWDEFYDVFKEYSSEKSFVYCDSISMKLLLRIFGFQYMRNRAGSSETDYLLERKLDNKITVLSAFYISFFGDDQIVLEDNLVDLDLCAASLSGVIPEGNSVFIGISSPKQNFLAIKISELRPDLEIFCLGAVISTFVHKADVEEMSSQSNTGLEWLFHLKRDPIRFVKKIRLIVVAIFKIFFFDKGRFLEFGRLLKRN